MKLILLIFLFFAQTVAAQIHFSGYQWSGDTADFTSLDDGSVMLNAEEPHTTATLTALNADAANTAEWHFRVKLNCKPSADNMVRVFVASDQTLSAGIGVAIGNTNKCVSLAKLQGGRNFEIVRGEAKTLDVETSVIDVKVVRKHIDDATDNLSLFYSVNGADTISAGSADVERALIDTLSYMSLYVKYTTTRAREKFIFDYLKCEPVSAEPDVPVVPPTPTDTVPVEPDVPVVPPTPADTVPTDPVIPPTPTDTVPDVPVVPPTPTDTVPQEPVVPPVPSDPEPDTPVAPTVPPADVFYRGMVVITELMPIPSAELGLPNEEYVEIFNASDSVIDLTGWTLSALGKTKAGKLPSCVMQPGEYLLLCSSTKTDAFAAFGNVAGVTSWQALVNDGATLMLSDARGRVSDFVTYSVKQFGNSFKRDGGWAIERIDVANLSGRMSNWLPSVDNNGGTPCRANSVAAPNADADAPKAQRLTLSDDHSVINVLFDEPIDTASLPIYIKVNGASVPVSVQCTDSIFLKSFGVTLNEPLQRGMVYNVSLEGFADLAGNAADMRLQRLGVAEPVEVADVLISEIMATAKPSSNDYLEFVNVSQKVLDARDICVGIITDGELTQRLPLSGESRYIFPGDYFVACTDSLAVVERFDACHPANVVQVRKFPNLPDEGTVALTTLNGSILDAVPYGTHMYSEALATTVDVSLERVMLSKPSDYCGNWAPAAASSGYATPTCPNSQSRDGVQPSSKQFEMVVPIFTPNADGTDDEMLLRCNFPEGQWTATLRIYDSRGRMVAMPYSNSLMPVSGELRWNGTDSTGAPQAPGTYIMLLSAWSSTGETLEHKAVCTLAVTPY